MEFTFQSNSCRNCLDFYEFFLFVTHSSSQLIKNKINFLEQALGYQSRAFADLGKTAVFCLERKN